MKPVCVKCRRFLYLKKSGFYFREAMPNFGLMRATPGIEHDDQWRDYKLWVGDLYECKGCGTQIISGVGHQPISEHFHDDYQAMVDLTKADLRVNDC